METTQNNKPWYYGHRQRMAEKIAVKGMDSLTESEVLEELLMRAIPRRDVKPIVKELLSKFKSLSHVSFSSVDWSFKNNAFS